MSLVTHFYIDKPLLWEFVRAVRHIFSTKYSQCETFSGREVRLEFRMKVFTHRLYELIDIALLHHVMYGHLFTHMSIFFPRA